MSIRKSTRDAIVGVLDTITDVAKGAQETVEIGTSFVHHRAVAFKLTDRESVLLDTARTLTELQKELDANPKLAQVHAELAKKLGW